MAPEDQAVEELVVTVVDDEKPDAATDTVVKAEDPATDAVKDISQQLEAMRRQSAADRAAAVAAKAEARAATQESAVIRTGAVEAQYGSVVAGLDAAESEAKSIAREIKDALDAGEYQKAADAQVRAGEVGYRIGRLKEAKSDMDSRRETPERTSPAPAPAPADPVEAYVANRTQPTATWLRQHAEFITDPLKNKKLTAAHFDAEGEGYQADTPEYFAHVEKYLGIGKADEPAPTPEPKPAVTAKPAAKRAPAAPVSPTSNNGATASRNEVRLTKSEAEAATDGTHVWNYDDPTGKARFKKGEPIGIQEFARRKREMIASGVYDRTYVDQ